ncbi:MAG: class I SAM-dependent methyltransferase [Tepidisphaeraceae bacterium]|jgi:ubiquinone/menaquinone biosynthesis C-methylase UbiE
MAKTKAKSKPKVAKAKITKAPISPQRLTEFAWGFAPMLIIHAAIKNRVFDVLNAGPKTLEEIAAATQSSQRGLRALLEALVGFGILHRRRNRFSLAPDTAAFMVSTKPGYLGGVVQHFAAQLLDNWRQLPEIVRTGNPATMVDHEDQGAEFFSRFVEDLFNLNFAAAAALADDLAKRLPAHDGNLKILDIAAGSGVWGFALAKRIPQAHITALDFAKVLPVTRRVAERHQLAGRLSTIEGDMQHVDFGRGFHVATLGHILHSEGQTKSRHVLKKVYDALAPGGIIAIAEFVPNDDRNGPAYPLLFAVNMLVHTEDGDTFTFKQMTGWLKEIGFRKIRRVEVPAPSPILVAVRP